MSLSDTSKAVFGKTVLGRPVPHTAAVETYITNLNAPEEQTKAWRLFMLLAENYRQQPASGNPPHAAREWHSLDLGRAFLQPAANTRAEKRLTGLKRKIHILNKTDAKAAIDSVEQATQSHAPSQNAPRKFAR